MQTMSPNKKLLVGFIIFTVLILYTALMYNLSETKETQPADIINTSNSQVSEMTVEYN